MVRNSETIRSRNRKKNHNRSIQQVPILSFWFYVFASEESERTYLRSAFDDVWPRSVMTTGEMPSSDTSTTNVLPRVLWVKISTRVIWKRSTESHGKKNCIYIYFWIYTLAGMRWGFRLRCNRLLCEFVGSGGSRNYSKKRND